MLAHGQAISALEAGWGGESEEAAHASAGAGWGEDGVAVGQRGSLEAGPVEADGAGVGEVDDGAAGGVDQADVARAARGMP